MFLEIAAAIVVGTFALGALALVLAALPAILRASSVVIGLGAVAWAFAAYGMELVVFLAVVGLIVAAAFGCEHGVQAVKAWWTSRNR